MNYQKMAKPGYTQEQMKAAFDMVKNPENWKYVIDIVVDYPGIENLNCVREAIIHFTGSFPEIKDVGGKVRIQAAGYYATIGA